MQRMAMITLLILGFLGDPIVALGNQLDFEEQATIAERVTNSLRYITVEAVPAPRLNGFDPIAIFWIRNNEQRDYTYMFSKGRYTFQIDDPKSIMSETTSVARYPRRNTNYPD